MAPSTIPEPNTLPLPRVLCLHGGGTNAAIFFAQMRAMRTHLRSYFRLVFVDSPFLCPELPDDFLRLVYPESEYGPARRWCRSSLADGPLVDGFDTGDGSNGADSNDTAAAAARAAVDVLDRAVCDAMRADDLRGATGPWVGVLGFSQGSKMAASLLFRDQVRAEALTEAKRTGDSKQSQACLPDPVGFRFGVLMAGRGPIIALDPALSLNGALILVSEIELQQPPTPELLAGSGHRLTLPTVHVHGLQDPGLPGHRELLKNYCVPGSTRLVEWNDGHRLPFKTADVQSIVSATLVAASEAGVLV